MRHYEIIFLVHPDRSDQTQSILSKFSSVVTDSGGVVHRSENIGNRRLFYPIQDQFKAFFGLMNIECNQEVIKEIKDSFKFNDSIIRDLVILMKKAHTETSALSSQTDEDEKPEFNLDSKNPLPSKDKKEQNESKEENILVDEVEESSTKDIEKKEGEEPEPIEEKKN